MTWHPITQFFCPCLLKVSGSSRRPRERRLPKYCMHHIRSSKSEARYQPNKLENLLYTISWCTLFLQKHINCVEFAGTFESVGKSELQNAGKAGLVTVQGKISVVLGTVLISKITGLCYFPDKFWCISSSPSHGHLCAGAYLFITFFPDQAEKLFELAGISLWWNWCSFLSIWCSIWWSMFP